MGGPQALPRWGERPLLDPPLELLRRPGVDDVLAVVGHGAEEVRAALSSPVTLAVNPDPDRGMLSSILVALDAASTLSADAVLLHPVDHPLVSTATVDAVVQ